MTGGGDVRCPKCDAGLTVGQSACPRCGLGRTHFDSYEQEADQAPEHLDAAWTNLLADWDSDDAHDKFCRLVMDQSAFAFAGRRYRDAGRSRGADDVRVVRGLERVRSMAEATWLVKHGERIRKDESTAGKRTLSLVLILVLALAVGVMALFMIKRITPSEAPAKRAVPAERRTGSDNANVHPGPGQDPAAKEKNPTPAPTNAGPEKGSPGAR